MRRKKARKGTRTGECRSTMADKAQIQEAIKVQGEVVRKLKAEKASKDQVCMHHMRLYSFLTQARYDHYPHDVMSDWMLTCAFSFDTINSIVVIFCSNGALYHDVNTDPVMVQLLLYA